MRNIIVYVVAIVVTLAACSDASASPASQRAEREREQVNSVTAAKYVAITPEVFQKVEKLIKDKGMNTKGMWHADELGFRIRLTSNEIRHFVIITWDGKIVRRIDDGWGGTTFTQIGDWNSLK